MGTEQTCFADEVVIDFPSIAPCVDRIVESFLDGERPSAVAAEVQVSRREAFYGATIPMDVPVRNVCMGCGGRGETWMERCLTCDGTGDSFFRHRVSVTIPAGIHDGTCFAFSLTPPSALPTRIEVRVSVR